MDGLCEIIHHTNIRINQHKQEENYMSESYNPHAVKRIRCRQKRLDQELIIAIAILKGTELAEGENLHGTIHWSLGLVLDDDRDNISDEELMQREAPDGGPFYPFRYDGKKLELFNI